MTADIFYDDFAAALRAPHGDAAPECLQGLSRKRFIVYRNNVHSGFLDALAAAYPVVTRLVGPNFFKGLARAYYAAAPRGTVALALYGEGLAEFLEEFPPAAGLPYLPDVARLERAWLESYHAPDAGPLTPASLAQLGDRLPGLRFRPHPACRLVHSPHPVHSIWQAQRDDADKMAIITRPEAALVTRPAWDVSVRPLDADAAAFAQTLLAGRTVETAYAAAAALNPDFDVTGIFGLLLSAGSFVSLLQGDDQ